MTHKAEILCFHSADDGVLHKPGCPVGFYSHEFHCSLLHMEKEKFNNMQNATTQCRLKHANNKPEYHVEVMIVFIGQRVKYVLYYICIARQRPKSVFYIMFNNQVHIGSNLQYCHLLKSNPHGGHSS